MLPLNCSSLFLSPSCHEFIVTEAVGGGGGKLHCFLEMAEWGEGLLFAGRLNGYLFWLCLCQVNSLTNSGINGCFQCWLLKIFFFFLAFILVSHFQKILNSIETFHVYTGLRSIKMAS